MSLIGNELTPEFQTLLLRAIAHDSRFLNECRDCLDSSFFQNPDEAKLAGLLLSYFDKHHDCLSLDAFLQVLADNKLSDEYDGYARKLYSAPPREFSYLKERIIPFAKKRAMLDSLLSVSEMVKRGEFEAAEQLFLRAAHVGDGRPKQTEYFDNINERVLGYRNSASNERRVPTGISFIDKRTNGGIDRGEFAFVMADTGVGKTHFLLNIGKNAVLLGGHKVAYYTLEVSERVLSRRLDMSFSGMTKHELMCRPREAIQRIQDAISAVKDGRFFIFQYSAGALDVNKLSAHLRLLRDRDGFIPDLVIVDYGDLMSSMSRYKEYRHELSSIFSGLRAIGVEHDVAVWSATQSNREAAKRTNTPSSKDDTVVEKWDVREDYNKIATADLVVTLNQSVREKRNKSMRICIVKYRDGMDGDVGTVTADWSVSQIRDADSH
jgi:replicative DNA helicase